MADSVCDEGATGASGPVEAEAELSITRAKAADDAATIARQKLEIAKLKRQIYGARSERTARLLDQMELELEDLEAAATEDELDGVPDRFVDLQGEL